MAAAWKAAILGCFAGMTRLSAPYAALFGKHVYLRSDALFHSKLHRTS
jgi:hypothetical protein